MHAYMHWQVGLTAFRRAVVLGLQLTARLCRKLFRGLAAVWMSAEAAVFERLSGLSKQLLGTSEACRDRGGAVLLKSSCGKLLSAGRLAQLAMVSWWPLTAQGYSGVAQALHGGCVGIALRLHRRCTGVTWRFHGIA